MKQRTITAIFFSIVMLLGVLGGTYSFLSIFLVITAVCLWEFYQITLKEESLFIKLYASAVSLTPYIWVALERLLNTTTFDYASLLALLFILLSSTFIVQLYRKSALPFSVIGTVFTGFIYIGIPFTLLQFIAYPSNAIGYVYKFPLGIMLLCWANDSFAYLFGSKWGKNSLFKSISPKKTWEGTIMGAIMTLLVSIILGFLLDEGRLFVWIGIGIIVGIFGTIGDLVESQLKRSYGIKDSGNILPGHGGFLDRFDAFLFTIPFVFVWLYLNGLI
ncbi:MAG: phosphatidate cytidylyltransferase [Saprospiraceae bacterium]|nr:phosphatidate cytidylyltransferase [Saprospiraceae bacterium]